MAIVGTPTHGLPGIPITTITANGETTPWPISAGIYGIQIYGTWDTASAAVQIRLHDDATWLALPGTAGPFSADGIEPAIQGYNGAALRVVISSVGASTDLDAVLRGPRSRE